ncbi:MAG: hypothetical protein ABSA47_06910 [Verrucomicrobiota bacterium]|jgi:hypothetical protein
MKKVFMVTYSDDEPPASQVADVVVDALKDALSHAEELGITLTAQPSVVLEGYYPDFDDFRQHYTLLKNRFDSSSALDGCLFGWVGQEWEAVRNGPPKNLWTLIECEGLWWISPGFHYVNRLGYLLTTEPRKTDDQQYLYD